MQKDLPVIAIRLTPELKAQVEELAKADHRSVNQFMTVLIEKVVSERSAQQK